MNKRNFLFAGIHVVFCTFLIYFFYTNSLIRPYAVFHPYKEIICALLVILLIYLGYSILTPYFIKRYKYKSYALLSLLAIGVVSIAELLIVKADILRCIGYNEALDTGFLLFGILFVIFLRDMSFYLFFTMLKLYLLTKEKALLEKKVALKDAGLVLLPSLRGNPISININFVSYFSQNKNHTSIHSTVGNSLSIYSSLNAIQDYLHDYCLRINRDTIITFTNIISYNETSVLVKENPTNMEKSLPFFKNNAKNVLSVLREKVPHLEEKNETIPTKNDTVGRINHKKDDEMIKNGGINNLILEEIKKNNGISIYQLAEILQEKITLRTLERRLKELKDFGKIEHRGSKKTGGYYMIRK